MISQSDLSIMLISMNIRVEVELLSIFIDLNLLIYMSICLFSLPPADHTLS